MDIFKTLMPTRRTPMYPEHVGALNLIELEYYKDKTVLAQWRAPVPALRNRSHAPG
jgi:Family of unknown function (DUF6680)